MSAAGKPILVLHSYGNPEAHYLTVLALLSLQKQDEEAFRKQRVAVYTDYPEYFRRFFRDHPNFFLETLTNGRIAEWKGRNQYTQRLKIKLLEDCLRKFTTDVLFTESEVVFTQSPKSLFEHIGPTSVVFHSRESTLAVAEHTQNRRAIRELQKVEFTLRGEAMHLPADTAIWNTAVVGLSVDHQQSLTDILSVTDQLYSVVQHPLVEQLAFGFVLSRLGTLTPANEVVQHYGKHRAAVLPRISAVFATRNNLEGAHEALQFLENPGRLPTQRSEKRGLLAKLFG
jgi:hypothetical protein